MSIGERRDNDAKLNVATTRSAHWELLLLCVCLVCVSDNWRELQNLIPPFLHGLPKTTLWPSLARPSPRNAGRNTPQDNRHCLLHSFTRGARCEELQLWALTTGMLRSGVDDDLRVRIRVIPSWVIGVWSSCLRDIPLTTVAVFPGLAEKQNLEVGKTWVSHQLWAFGGATGYSG